jgi:spore coat polysaccharide biosynthesis protein SpsF (cytidylyltransferase family)
LYYFLKTDLFKVVPLDVDESLLRPDYRFALDYPEDFEFLKAVYEGIGMDTYKKTTKEIIDFVDAHPELAAINKDCNKKMQERSKADPASEVKLKGGKTL